MGRGAALPALAHEGNRNNTLNTEAFKAAKRGEDRADAYAMLRDVCTLEPAEFDRTFESGWTAGQAERGWNGRRANGDARGSTGVDSSPREGSDTDLNAVPLDALSEGVFARAWAEAHGPDEFLYAKGEGWLRYRSGRWRDGECAARQSMSEMIMGKIEGTELAKRFGHSSGRVRISVDGRVSPHGPRSVIRSEELARAIPGRDRARRRVWGGKAGTTAGSHSQGPRGFPGSVCVVQVG